MSNLDILTELSHKYGGCDYVKGGGGNTSVKDKDTLWVKPSGTTLATIKAEDFVAVDRKKLSELDNLDPSLDANERERLVQDIMSHAKPASSDGRPSVEAPLHNLLKGRFVVHTHPAVINGMLCSKRGSSVCTELFKDALWVDYIDPGFTLYRCLREKIKSYEDNFGRQPNIIFLKNHGVFISADSTDGIDQIYQDIFDKLKSVYGKEGISCELSINALADESTAEQTKGQILANYPDKPVYVAISGAFDIANGPLTPDHIVYAGSFALEGEPTEQKIQQHHEKFGALPRVIAYNDAVFAVGKSQSKAELALELAQNAALVKKLAKAFGGVEYMDDRARLFIESWEVEVYRSKQI